MTNIIAMQDIRTSLAEIADRVSRGECFIVVRNSRPAFQIVPLETPDERESKTKGKTLREMRGQFHAKPVKKEELTPDELDRLIHDAHDDLRGRTRS